MQFVCDKCKAKYDIDEARLRGKSVKIRCRGCGNVLEVRDPHLASGPRPAPPSPAAPPRGRERLATPIGLTPRSSAAPPRAAAVPARVPPAPVLPAAAPLGERFQQAFAGREAVPAAGPPAGPPPPPPPAPGGEEGDATHIIANPFVGEAAKGTAAQEVARKLARWHVSIRNQPMGPMSEEAVRRHIENGEVNLNSLVWREGFDEWRPLGQVRDLGYLAELAVKAGGLSRESVFELPPMQRAALASAAPPPSPLRRWLVQGAIAAVFFVLGLLVMYLVSGGNARPAGADEPVPSGLPAVEEVAAAGEPLPTLHSGSLTIQLTNPTVVAEEVIDPGAASSGGTPDPGGGTKRTNGRPGTGSRPGTTGADGGGSGTTGFRPGQDLGPVGGEIRTGAGTAGAEAPAPRPLSAQQILPVVQAGQSGIQHCYNQARARDFVTDLSVRLTIEISPDGSVRQATLASQDYLTGDLEVCIIGRVRTWQFPRATATSRVVLPFSFQDR
jgi:predicted Zn finger-like uncharacterized protein